MRGKKYLVLIGALVVSAGAITIPEQMINKTIDQSFGKVVIAKKITDEGKVAVLNKEESYKLTSLMMQEKLKARKEFIKKVPSDEFYKKFPDFDIVYSANRVFFENEEIYPMINKPVAFINPHNYKYDAARQYKEIVLNYPIVSLYHYKENIFYNFETPIWEAKWTDQSGIITYSILIDENLRAYQTEVKINEPDKGTELKTLHLNAGHILAYLRLQLMERVDLNAITDVIKSASGEQQRFVLETSSKEQYYLDVTSTKTLFRMEMKAVAE